MRISDWSSDVCSSDLHAVDQADADEEQERRSEVDDDVVHAGSDAGNPRAMQGQAVGCRQQDLEEDEQVEQVAEIGRASCRERVCQYVWVGVVAVSIKK